MKNHILAFCLLAITALAVSLASAAEPTSPGSAIVEHDDTRSPVTFAAMARRQPTTAAEPPPVSFQAMSQRAPLRAPPSTTSQMGPVKPAQSVLNRAPSTKPQFQWQQVCGRRGCSWQLVPMQPTQ